MNIYILTFHRTSNYGAALQAYALSTYLTNLGAKVYIVDYDPDSLADSYHPKLRLTASPLQWPKAAVLYFLARRKKWRMNQFNANFLRFTKRCTTCDEVAALERADLFIVGSDQVWNMEITGRDITFFLPFPFHGKKIAYAASAGSTQALASYRDIIMPYLRDFAELSVREDVLRDQLQQDGFPDCRQVLDPVFLLDSIAYRNIAIIKKQSPYILFYEMNMDPQLAEIAKALGLQHGLRVIQINRINNRYGLDKLYPSIGPREFLGLIADAAFVVTNSFHGTAFSIIFEKQFYTRRMNQYGERIISLLKKLHLMDRIIDDPGEINTAKEINYVLVARYLSEEITKSKNFLRPHVYGGE